MGFTPVEIRHLQLPRGMVGYRTAVVDRTLAGIAGSFEEVWRERAELADRVEHLEQEIVRYRELESLLRQTLMSAERTAHELKDQAKREAGILLEEAHAEAREIAHDARSERERLISDTARIRALLGAALDAVDDAIPETERAEAA
jgi:cell division initiation protein